MLRRWGSALLLCAMAVPAWADSLDEFSEAFWKWRAVEQPFSEDDIPRLERPADLKVDWSAEAIGKRRAELVEFERRFRMLPASGRPMPEQVDARLLASALARVRWELEIEQGWKRNPRFYVDQSLGAVYILLLPAAPFEHERQRQLAVRLASIPEVLAAGRSNLADMRRPFAQLAIDDLARVTERIRATQTALDPMLEPEIREAMGKSAPAAIAALLSYRAWLQERVSELPEQTAIGRDNYLFFLRNVAVMPFSPDELLRMGRQEWERSVAFESYEQTRNSKVPELALFSDQAAQSQRERHDEESIRAFLGAKGILTVPAWMQHYRNLPLPGYLEPFTYLGVTDDLTGPSRLDQDGVSYIQRPSRDLGFFSLSTARDPRPIIVHEGVPGHYFQLCLSWKHPDPIRRHYYDSGANEGIGFYAEEMMLQAGLFDDSPRTREIIYSFMRLRALRVEVDVKLALGEFTIEQAAQYLARTVPMDAGTARQEAAMFASTPGQAISYQIGKLQIVRLLADARRTQGTAFSLRNFHDFIWLNGNVPIALQRWELLGDPSEVPGVK